MGTLRRECPGHLLIHGEQHLRKILAEYERHYNNHRPHQAREQRPPLYEPGEVADPATRVKRQQTVQGLINEKGSLEITPNTRSELIREFWHGTGCRASQITVMIADSRGPRPGTVTEAPSRGAAVVSRSRRVRSIAGSGAVSGIPDTATMAVVQEAWPNLAT